MTLGAVKVTVASLSTDTLLPNVMAVALEQEQVVPPRYVALVITPSTGQSGHSELVVWVRVKVFPAMVIVPVLSLLVAFPSRVLWNETSSINQLLLRLPSVSALICRVTV